ncbi:unnamed protein product [Symbiodinium sp. CCMP2592]|nr:unnamed protein product [Symbiodinium sp. CCMP2592]
MWPNDVLNNPRFVRTTPASSSSLSFTHEKKLVARASLQDISATATLAIGFGLASVSGSVRLLQEDRTNKHTAEVVANYKVLTERTSLNIHDATICDERLDLTAYPGLGQATHVVTEIIWGNECGGVFTKTTQSESTRDIDAASVRVKVNLLLKTVTKTIADHHHESASSSSSEDISVHTFGDLLPDGESPTDAASAVRYMLNMPDKVRQGGAVPKLLTLTPVDEVCAHASQTGRRLSPSRELYSVDLPERFVSLALQMLQELEDAEACWKELQSFSPHGFLSLASTVNCHLWNIHAYRIEFGKVLHAAIARYRATGETLVLDEALQSFHDAGFSASDTDGACEALHADFLAASSLASFMEAAASLRMASRFSDFSKILWSPDKDLVYMLVYVGSPGSENKGSLDLLKGFVNMAAEFRHDNASPHCIRNGTGQQECFKDVGFTLVQFDTFCQQFCSAQHCQQWCQHENCTHQTVSGLSFEMPDELWCQSPYSVVMRGHKHQRPELVDEHLLALPKLEVTLEEGQDLRQEAVLDVEMDCAPPDVLNYILRVSREVSRTLDPFTGRTVRKYAQIDYEVQAGDLQVVLSIDRGSLNSFSVAAVAAAGTSPFSNEVSLTAQSCSSGAGRCLQTETGLTILPVPVAGERSTRRALLELGREQRDRVPSWLCFAITIVLSSPASERLVSVDFVDPNNTRKSFTCVGNGDSFDTIHCWMPAARTSADLLWQYRIKGDSGAAVAEEGTLIQEAPSIEACRRWEQAYYCHSSEPVCVQNCHQCSARKHAPGRAPNCEEPGAYWAALEFPETTGGVAGSQNESGNGQACSLPKYWELGLERRLSGSVAEPTRDDIKVKLKIQSRSMCPTRRDVVRGQTCSNFRPAALTTSLQQLKAKLHHNHSLLLSGEVHLDLLVAYDSIRWSMRPFVDSLAHLTGSLPDDIAASPLPMWVRGGNRARVIYAVGIDCADGCVEISLQLKNNLTRDVETGALSNNLMQLFQRQEFPMKIADLTAPVLRSFPDELTLDADFSSTLTSTPTATPTTTTTRTRTRTTTTNTWTLTSATSSRTTLTTSSSTSSVTETEEPTTVSSSTTGQSHTLTSTTWSTSTSSTLSTASATSTTSATSTSSTPSTSSTFTSSSSSLSSETSLSSTSSPMVSSTSTSSSSSLTTSSTYSFSSSTATGTAGVTTTSTALGVGALTFDSVITVVDVSAFNETMYISTMARLAGVPAENIMVTSVSFTTLVSLALSGNVDDTVAKQAIAAVVGVNETQITLIEGVQSIGSRRLSTSFDCSITVADVSSSAVVSELVGDATILSEGFADQGLLVSVTPSAPRTLISVSQAVLGPSDFAAPNNAALKDGLEEVLDTELEVSIMNVQYSAPATDAPEESSTSSMNITDVHTFDQEEQSYVLLAVIVCGSVMLSSVLGLLLWYRLQTLARAPVDTSTMVDVIYQPRDEQDAAAAWDGLLPDPGGVGLAVSVRAETGHPMADENLPGELLE